MYKTRYTRLTPAEPPLARYLLVVQKVGMRTRTRSQPPLVAKVAPAEEGAMSPPKQAGSVARRSASCSRSQGDGGGLYAIPLLHEEPLGRGGRVRQRRDSGHQRSADRAVLNILENPLVKRTRMLESFAWLWRRGGTQARTLPPQRTFRRCYEGLWRRRYQQHPGDFPC